MNAADAVLGTALILLIAWAVLLQLNQASLSNTVGAIALQQIEQEIMLSPAEFCQEKEGMPLVEEKDLKQEEYIVTAGTSNGKKFLCFYKKSEKNS